MATTQLHINHLFFLLFCYYFDFYTAADLRDVLPLLAELQQHVPEFSADHIADGTLIGHQQEIELSFFRYQYPMLESLVPAEGLHLASVPDIAAMKMAALAQRGLYRDFVDAESDTSMRGKTLLQPIAWETIKTFFSAEVRQLERVLL